MVTFFSFVIPSLRTSLAPLPSRSKNIANPLFHSRLPSFKRRPRCLHPRLHHPDVADPRHPRRRSVLGRSPRCPGHRPRCLHRRRPHRRCAAPGVADPCWGQRHRSGPSCSPRHHSPTSREWSVPGVAGALCRSIVLTGRRRMPGSTRIDGESGSPSCGMLVDRRLPGSGKVRVGSDWIGGCTSPTSYPGIWAPRCMNFVIHCSPAPLFSTW